jgi:RimJ/RimL family protein N-acetyltransferase
VDIKESIDFKILDRDDSDYYNIIQRLMSFDENRFCFFDQSVEDVVRFTKEKCDIYLLMHNKRIIGCFIVWEMEQDSKVFEFGYVIDSEYRNMGIAKKYFHEMVKLCFEKYKAESIYLFPCIDNVISNKIINEYGFQKFSEGESSETKRFGKPVYEKYYFYNKYKYFENMKLEEKVR